MSGITTRSLEANGMTFMVDEAGTGDAIALCLHGFPENRLSWRHQLEPLAALGWRAVAPDMRGYGESGRPSGVAAYDIAHLVADAAALFDAYGASRRLLVGHDWGALIAWTFAMQRRRPLDGLVIMNVPHPAVFRAVLRHSWSQRLRSWYVVFFQIPALPEAVLTAGRARIVGDVFRRMARDKSAFPDAVIERYRRDALRPGAMTAMLNYYRANARSLFRATETSPPIETPTLMIWGEADRALGLELTRGYEPYVLDMTLHRLPGVSHWVQQEAPARVNTALAGWLSDHDLVLGGD